MTNQDAMLKGLCPDCGNKLHHGPWTPEQIKEAGDEIGMDDPSEFFDMCDPCFVEQVCYGDAEYAQTLVTDHTLVLTTEQAA